MSILTMDMSSYEVERSETPGHDEERPNAGWVPALGLRELTTEPVEMPAAPRIEDVNAFLRKMYRCRH